VPASATVPCAGWSTMRSSSGSLSASVTVRAMRSGIAAEAVALRELATLPGAYAAPRGLLLLAGEPGDAFGCVALRPLPGKGGAGVAAAVASDATPVPIGEVKRLYVQPRARGQRWGQRLAAALVEQARAIGYRELVLDTLDWMKPARALYAQLGFVDCPPYYDNPLAGVVYMRCVL